MPDRNTAARNRKAREDAKKGVKHANVAVAAVAAKSSVQSEKGAR